MDLGIALPTSARYASPEAIVQVAQAAEKLGYTAVWTYERLLYALGDIPQPGGPPRPLPSSYKLVYEPIETLTFVAARTKTIRLGTSVIVAPFHVPVVLARRLATLDHLSGGRVIAGLGQGWMKPEYVAANIPLARRGARLEEFVAALRAAWGPDPVWFEGEFYNIPPSEINPKPLQEGGIPIILAAFAPAAIERAGRIADGYNPIAFGFDHLRQLVESFREAAETANRDPTELKVMVRANVSIASKPAGAGGRDFLSGAPEQVAEDLAALRDLEIDHVFFNNLAARSVDEQIKLMDRLQDAFGRS
jgi:probable F420-dependent oxidoreductase